MQEQLLKAIIVDVDGTLALMNGRSPYDWSKVREDKVNEPIKNIVNRHARELAVIIFSGRDGSCEKQTVKWLRDNDISFDDIFMRPAGNNEKDAVIKRRMYDEHIAGKYEIEFVLDDRDQVVEMWRKELGLTCLQVNYGNF